MNDDDLSIFDVGRAILTGRAPERRQDLVTGEWSIWVLALPDTLLGAGYDAATIAPDMRQRRRRLST